jgi:hypothetical protein
MFLSYVLVAITVVTVALAAWQPSPALRNSGRSWRHRSVERLLMGEIWRGQLGPGEQIERVAHIDAAPFMAALPPSHLSGKGRRCYGCRREWRNSDRCRYFPWKACVARQIAKLETDVLVIGASRPLRYLAQHKMSDAIPKLDLRCGKSIWVRARGVPGNQLSSRANAASCGTRLLSLARRWVAE